MCYINQGYGKIDYTRTKYYKVMRKRLDGKYYGPYYGNGLTKGEWSIRSKMMQECKDPEHGYGCFKTIKDAFSYLSSFYGIVDFCIVEVEVDGYLYPAKQELRSRDVDVVLAERIRVLREVE